MGIHEGGQMAARAALFEALEQLEHQHKTLSSNDLVARVDDIRKRARAHGFFAFADMAHGIETLLARGQEMTGLKALIFALKEGLGADELDAKSVHSWLAALGHHSGH